MKPKLRQILEDTPTLDERYGTSARTSDLTLHLTKRSDADILLAAGYATAGEQRMSIALKVWRMQVEGSRSEIGSVVESLMSWLVIRSHAIGRTDKALRLRRPRARSIAEVVISWLLSAACPRCQGRKYELVPGTQVTSDKLCLRCHGSGKPALEVLLPDDSVEHGRWLVCEIEQLHARIFSDMARALSQRMDLTL